MKDANITPEMNRCLSMIDEHGTIDRHPGGYWNRPNAKKGEYEVGYVRTGTVEALANRGIVEPAETKTNRNGSFVVKYRRK